MDMLNEKISLLITGGFGFAGWNMCSYLQKKGCYVTATYRNDKPERRIEGVNYVKQELAERISINGKFDAIIHTAACSEAGNTISIAEYIRDNIDSARRIVEYATENGVDKVFYFSTRSIYGEIRESSVSETNDIINPDKYGQTKYIAEEVFKEAKGIKTLGFRTPGIVGAGAHDIWLASVVKQMYANAPVCVSDFNTKNLVYIDDISQFIYESFARKAEDVFAYPVVNLACEQSINNLEIVNIIKSRIGSKSDISIKNADSRLFQLDGRRAIDIGFRPRRPEDVVNSYLDILMGQEKA